MTMRKILGATFVALIVLSIAFSTQAAQTPGQPQNPSAQGLVQCGGTGQPACGVCDIFTLITNIVNFFLIPTAQNNYFAIVPILAALLFMIGGGYLVLGGGNPQMLEKGKTILTAVVVGLIIVYAAWLFLNTLFMALGVQQWVGLGDSSGRFWKIQGCP